MSYPNAYLRDFVPVLGQILKEKQIAPENCIWKLSTRNPKKKYL